MKYIKKFERSKQDEINRQAKVDVLTDLLNANPLSEDHDFYLFIAKESFEEAENGLYKKTLEIENMVKITPDQQSVASMAGLQLRAVVQHDSKLYHIWLPKEIESFVSGKGSRSLEKWVVDLINKYKMSPGKGNVLINPNLNVNKEFQKNIEIRKELDKFNL